MSTHETTKCVDGVEPPEYTDGVEPPEYTKDGEKVVDTGTWKNSGDHIFTMVGRGTREVGGETIKLKDGDERECVIS